jgi:hypothetical protein
MDENIMMGVFKPNCKIRFLSDPKPTEDYIAISASELIELVAAQMKLMALESGGVDNWEWYGESLHEYMRELPNCYGEEFWSWARNEKALDETLEDFIDDLSIEDYARFEIEVM